MPLRHFELPAEPGSPKLLTQELQALARKSGEVIEYEGERYVVVQVTPSENPDEIAIVILAPEAYIDVNS
jgi:hypothetical protein